METVKIIRDTSYKTRFVDTQGHMPKVRVAIDLGYNIILRGPTGTGKTFLAKELANEYKKTMLVLNMTAGATVEEIKGRYVVQPDETGKTSVKWIDGVLVTAMKRGWWIVIEEANFMPEELASVFYSVMDDRRNIILDEHENEVVTAHPEFRLFMTANWGYKGTVIPNDAIRNRLDFYCDLAYLPEREEAELIVRETGVNKRVSELITKFAWSQRKIKSRHQPDISTRILIRWAGLINGGLTPKEAGEHTIVSLLFHEEKEKQKVRDALQFEFEALEAELEKEALKEKVKAKPKAPKPEVKPEPEEVKPEPKPTIKKTVGGISTGDLVSVTKHSKTFFGIVKKITTTRDGEKVWCLFNDKKEDAIRGIPSPFMPMESAALITDITLVKREGEY